MSKNPEVPLSTARQSLARLNKLIDAMDGERERAMMTVFRDHWWSEAIGDIDATMATLADVVHYTIDGNDMMGKGRWSSKAEALAVYQGIIDRGVNPAGPFDRERFGFADWGISFEAVLTGIYPGSMFLNPPGPLEPDQLYLTRSWAMHALPIDAERGLILGENGYMGTPFLIEAVDRSAIAEIIG